MVEEEADSGGFQFYKENGGKVYRIWIKDADVGEGKEQM